MLIENVKYQPRFQAFVNYHGLKVGDTFKNHEYIIFIQENLRNFLKTKGLNPHHYLNEQDHNEFTEYLHSLKGA